MASKIGDQGASGGVSGEALESAPEAPIEDVAAGASVDESGASADESGTSADESGEDRSDAPSGKESERSAVPGQGAQAERSLGKVFARLRPMLPQGRLGWASAILLSLVFIVYLVAWVRLNSELLFDTRLANDDARTAAFPFHMWGPDGALADDPIAAEMRHFVMPGITVLYRIFVPLAGIFVAPKLVQFVALGVLFWAGIVLARSRRGGFACGVLLVFMLLHNNFAINRLAGGFGRAFVFPCFALWLAGAISNRARPRYAAILIGALTQNYAVAILLGAEGVHSLLDSVGRSGALIRRRLKHYAVIVGLSFALVGGYAVTQIGLGSVHTIEQVERTVEFKSRHRQEYPLADPAPQFAKWLISPFASAGGRIPGLSSIGAAYEKHGTTWPLLFLAGLFCLGFARVSPKARPAMAFFVATVVSYTAARLVAFKLYAPERYYSFGMPMVGVTLAVMSIGLIAPRLPKYRDAIRNSLAAVFIAGLCLLAGNGILAKNGMSIDERPGHKLYSFVKTLPRDARIACHPWDGDDIPWWAGRATTGGFETAQMWLVEGAQRVKVRTDDVLGALYSTSREQVLDYAKKYKVSHFLIRPARYGEDVRKKAEFIEPFTNMTNRMLAPVKAKDLVFANVPESAVVYREPSLLILDVALLEAAWRAP